MLDTEVGPYVFKHVLSPGHYCRVLADSSADLVVRLRPTDFVPPLKGEVDDKVALSEIEATMETTPGAAREVLARTALKIEKRPHAVCTVQTFRNSQSGKEYIALTSTSQTCLLYFMNFTIY